MKCPTPWKASYVSRGEAKSSLVRGYSAPAKGQLRPYRCTCGMWHITSMTGNVRRQAKRRRP